MNQFNAEHELHKIHRSYQSYKKDMKNNDIDHQNAVANLYSLYIKRELKAIWFSDTNDTKTTEELNDYLINWFKLIRHFKNSIK